jgi:hypothetical protein
MLLCTDTINLVKAQHKKLRIQRSLSAKRSNPSREGIAAQSGRYTLLDHNEGRTESFYYERDNINKVASVS